MCGWSATQVARRWSSESCIPPSAVSCSKCHPTEGSCCFQACKYRTAWVNTTSVTAFASILECSFDVPLPPLPKERAARRPPCRSSPTTYGRACRQRRLCSPPWRPVVDERFCVAVVEEGALLARPAPLLLALGGREGGLLLAALAGRSARGRALHQVPPFFPCFSFLFLSACFTVHLLFSASTHGRVASARGRSQLRALKSTRHAYIRGASGPRARESARGLGRAQLFGLGPRHPVLFLSFFLTYFYSDIFLFL